jgi:hypothetical protein
MLTNPSFISCLIGHALAGLFPSSTPCTPSEVPVAWAWCVCWCKFQAWRGCWVRDLGDVQRILNGRTRMENLNGACCVAVWQAWYGSKSGIAHIGSMYKEWPFVVSCDPQLLMLPRFGEQLENTFSPGVSLPYPRHQWSGLHAGRGVQELTARVWHSFFSICWRWCLACSQWEIY